MNEQFALWLTVIMLAVMVIGITWLFTDRIVELRHRVNKLEINRRLDEADKFWEKPTIGSQIVSEDWIKGIEKGLVADVKEPPKRKWVKLTKEECADIWADAHDIDGKMIWTPEQLFDEMDRRLKEKNT